MTRGVAVMAYKLRAAGGADYVEGYAARIRLEEGSVRLEDRRLPLWCFGPGSPVARPVRLGDLELDTAPGLGWAIRATLECVPWWEGPGPEEAPAAATWPPAPQRTRTDQSPRHEVHHAGSAPGVISITTHKIE